MFVLTPFQIKAVGATNYGFIIIILSFTLYSGLLDLGLGRALTFKVASVKGDAGRLRVAVGTAIAMTLALSIVSGWAFSLIALPSVGQALGLSNGAATGLSQAKVSLFLIGSWSLLATPPLAILNGLARFSALNIVGVVSSIASQLIPTAYALLIGNDLPGLLAAVATSKILVAFVACAALLRPLGFVPRFSHFSFLEAGELLAYGKNQLAGTLVSYATSTLERPMIAGICGASAVTYYSIPESLSARLAVIVNALAATTFPSMSASDAPRRLELLSKSLKVMAVMAPTYLTLSIASEFILSVWINNSFAQSARIPASLLPLAAWLSAITFVYFNYLQAIGKPATSTRIVALVGFPFLPIMALAAWKFGLDGVVLAYCGRAIVGLFLFVAVTKTSRLFDRDLLPQCLVFLLVSLVTFAGAKLRIAVDLVALFISIICAALSVRANFLEILRRPRGPSQARLATDVDYRPR
jgi:O-antigen/teichoic acid export membrane protein